jgi:hypothetical protein
MKFGISHSCLFAKNTAKNGVSYLSKKFGKLFLSFRDHIMKKKYAEGRQNFISFDAKFR